MRYILTGFTHDAGMRVFAFQGIGEDRVREDFAVRADLALTRRFGIQMQELPLLCRGILERRDEGEQERAFTYTEAEMRVYSEVRALRVKPARKKPTPA